MPGHLSPFVKKEVACPNCGEVHEQRFFKQRQFVPEAVEDDQHVLSYKWLSETTRPVHPPWYIFYFCPHCYFTDQAEDFISPPTEAFNLMKAFRSRSDADDRILQFLGGPVMYEDINFHTALNLHYLALYIQLMVRSDFQDAYKIGRIFLRIAWLFREEGGSEGEKPKSFREDNRGRFIRSVKTAESALFEFKSKWSRLVDNANTYFDDDDADRKKPATTAFEKNAANIEKLQNALAAEVARMKTALGIGAESEENGRGGSGPEFYGFPSHAIYLRELKARWPEAPVSEEEGMKQCMPYLMKALSEDARFDSPRAYASLTTLLVNLRVRLGDLDGAYAQVHGAYRQAAENRMALQRKLRGKDIDESLKTRLSAQIRKCNETISYSAELRRELLDKIMRRDMPKIEAILKPLAGAGAKEKEEALIEGGIKKSLILHIKEKTDLIETEKKKRGLF
jgi:uncharacterized protein (DUF2225 family)